jgi:dihydrodipicolinate reductase
LSADISYVQMRNQKLNNADSVGIAETGQNGVRITASTQGVSGAGTVRVDFTDPEILSYWPNCALACKNAAVGAQINI